MYNKVSVSPKFQEAFCKKMFFEALCSYNLGLFFVRSPARKMLVKLLILNSNATNRKKLGQTRISKKWIKLKV